MPGVPEWIIQKTRPNGIRNIPWSYSKTNPPVNQQGSTPTVSDFQFIKTLDHSRLLHLLGRRPVHDIGGFFLSHRIQLYPNRKRLHLEYKNGPDLNGEYFIEKWSGEAATTTSFRTNMKRTPFNNFAQESAWIVSNTPAPLSNSSLDTYGATAVRMCAPTNPVVDLSVTLAELKREGLPHVVPQSGNVGSEYLNYEFGIKPVMSDGRDLITAMGDAERILDQYHRDSGRLIRREYEFPVEESTTSTVLTNQALFPYNGTPSGLLIQPGRLRTITKTRTKIWFRGAFMYHLPDDGFARKLRDLDKLYGIIPGPDTVYNLVAYSWLADWFTNLGDVMHNMNAFMVDGLVMPYGYLMRESRQETETTWTGFVKIANVWTPQTLTDYRIDTVKQRQPAHPYGFGFTDGDLTDRQKLILAALGLSRV